eukprot:scaffold1548_cov117-Isochrysis_galbana.AAC.6
MPAARRSAPPSIGRCLESKSAKRKRAKATMRVESSDSDDEEEEEEEEEGEDDGREEEEGDEEEDEDERRERERTRRMRREGLGGFQVGRIASGVAMAKHPHRPPTPQMRCTSSLARPSGTTRCTTRV